jgi:glutathione S-transferase
VFELWQTEWCPASRRVRQRLTELGVDYVVRQVPVAPDDRVALRERTGAATIPVLVADGSTLVGERDIDAFLSETVDEPAEATAHQLKAEKARRRYLDEECECLQPATH